MRQKKPRVVSLDEVRISRKGETAEFEYADSAMGVMNLVLGFDVANKTDAELLECHNDVVRAMEEMAAAHDHVAVEVPIGSPQIKYSRGSFQWVPRGDVVRCIVGDGGPDAEATIEVDDRELSLAEFGRMLTTYAGWGMRIAFVPDDEIHIQPEIEVREPEDEPYPDEGSDEEQELSIRAVISRGPTESPPVPQATPLSNDRAALQRMQRKPIYQLRVTLRDTEPPVWRRILVSGNRSMKKIHDILQAAMGWTNSHLHAFPRKGGAVLSDLSFEIENAIDEKRLRLANVAREIGSRFDYEYDFGDGWEHEIVVEDILDPATVGRLPRCIGGERACPPEDCGGPLGHADLVAAMKNKRHPERQRFMEWLGAPFEAEAFDVDEINRALRRIR